MQLNDRMSWILCYMVLSSGSSRLGCCTTYVGGETENLLPNFYSKKAHRCSESFAIPRMPCASSLGVISTFFRQATALNVIFRFQCCRLSEPRSIVLKITQVFSSYPLSFEMDWKRAVGNWEDNLEVVSENHVTYRIKVVEWIQNVDNVWKQSDNYRFQADF